jgi:CheY-like chemotaxis protein
VTKILLIEADPDRAAALAAALGGGGGATEVRIAPDGFYALTMMERERPDLIVAGGCVGGIGAGELGAIVRSDPTLAGVRLARYADPAAPPADLNGGGAYDLVLDGTAPARELAAGLRRLAGIPAAVAPRDATAETGETDEALLPSPAPGGPRDERPTPPPAPLHPSGYSTAEMPAPRLAAGRRPHTAAQPLQRPQPAPDLSGSLGVLDLMELSQAFSLASKTGQLFLDCSRGEGCIYFELGRVIHATIRERTGREAFSEILQATLREQNLAFRFAPREPQELAAVPRSIDLTVQHLLLSFAVDFDETQGS